VHLALVLLVDYNQLTGGPQSRNSKLGMLAGAASSALGGGIPRQAQVPLIQHGPNDPMGGINTGPSPMNATICSNDGSKTNGSSSTYGSATDGTA
jgi:hypothetical protein